MSIERPDDVHRSFVPPIEVIEDSLFGQAIGPVAGGEEEAVLSFMDIEQGEPGMAQMPETARTDEELQPRGDGAMPATLRHIIRQRLSAQQVSRSLDKPEAGMIVQVEPLVSARDHLSMDLPVLLDRLVPGNDIWRGWLVAPQTHLAYVSYWDLLLEEELDGPFDPAAAIVQTWNPVYVRVEKAALVLGRLGRERLSAARVLEHEFEQGLSEDACKPETGRFGVRELDGFSVVTGTPLGNVHDVRRDYQRLYSRAAAALSEQADEAVADALAEGWLTRIARNLEQWAANLGVPIATHPLIPQPMGMGEHASVYLLDKHAQLSLHPYLSEQALHVQVAAVGETMIEAVLKAGDEVLQTSNIGGTNRMADFFMDLRQGHVLMLRIPDQGLELEIPMT